MAERRTRVDWDAAFLYFAQLGPVERSYPTVAQRFSVSLTSVKKRAKAEDWQERVAKFDDEAARLAEHKGVRLRADRVADTIELIDTVRSRYGDQLDDADFEVRGSDLAALLRIEALLEGEATERVDIAEVHTVLRRFFEIALRRIPADERPEAEAEFEALLTGGAE